MRAEEGKHTLMLDLLSEILDVRADAPQVVVRQVEVGELGQVVYAGGDAVGADAREVQGLGLRDVVLPLVHSALRLGPAYAYNGAAQLPNSQHVNYVKSLLTWETSSSVFAVLSQSRSRRTTRRCFPPRRPSPSFRRGHFPLHPRPSYPR